MIGRLPWFGLLALLLLSPLPLGMVPPLASGVAALWLVLLLAGWAALALAGRVPTFWHGALWVPLALLAGVVGWMLVQTHYRVEPSALYRASSTVLGRPVASYLSLAPAQGAAALRDLLVPVATFWLSLQYGRDPAEAKRLLFAFVAAQAGYALYGLLDYIAGNGLLLWFPRWAYPDDITGTLVNRNNYATLAGLGLLSACALAQQAYDQELDRAVIAPSRFVRTIEALRGRPALLLCAILVIAMAWLQSHSRMGFASTVFGLLTMLSLGLGRPSRRRRAILFALVALGGALLLSVSGVGTLDRLDSGGNGDRLAILGTAARAVMLAPWAGSGAGAFQDAFGAVRDAGLPQNLDFAMAHDSYLQAAVELGIPAAAALVAAILWMMGLSLIGTFRRRRDRLYPVLGVGAGVLVATHSLLDFSIQIPAVAIAFACLLGVAVAQSFPSAPSLH